MEIKDLKIGSFYIIKSNKTGAELYVRYLGRNTVRYDGIIISLTNYTILREEPDEVTEKQAQIIELLKQNKDKIVFKEKITIRKENYIAIEYNEFEDEYFLRGENFLVNKRFLDVEEIDDLELILETVKKILIIFNEQSFKKLRGTNNFYKAHVIGLFHSFVP